MKMNVAVFFGCRSVEHEVSVISAVQAISSMNSDKYNTIPVYVAKNGVMYSGERLKDITAYKNIPELIKECYQVVFERTETAAVMIAKKSNAYKDKRAVQIDFAFPIVHGTNCEDGTIQGFIETLGIAYAGCDVMSSAVGMDKVIFKSVMQANDIPVVDGVSFNSREWVADRENTIKKIETKLGYPVIVKPANLGSSVGVAKAGDRSSLIEKTDLAASFAPKILVEKAVTQLREINCSVLGDSSKCEASVCEEPVMSDEILSYTDKYEGGSKSANESGSKGMASLSRIIPAKISDDKTKEIQDISKRVFEAVGCNGVVRIDYLIDKSDNDKVYVNEINTIPGSLAFYLWKAGGMEYSQLLDRIIELGQKRHRERANLMFTYDTNILANGSFGAKGAKK